MKKVLSFAAAALLSVSAIYSAVSWAESDENNWVLSWSDEFDGNTLDMSKWSYQTGNWLVDDKGNMETSGWGNNEQEYYTDRNTVVSDGTLKIQAKKETYTDPAQGTFDYTSSKLITKNKFSVCFGKIEVRARVDSGKSLWPAIWMLPEDLVYGKWAASGEIDIMEGYGSMPEKICGTIHFGDTWPNNQYLTNDYYFQNGDSTYNWHIYGLEWENDEMRWYVDGKLYSTQSNWSSAGRTYPAPFDQNFYMILNLAVGGHFDGIDGIYADPSIFADGPKELEVDYVRVYQKDGEVYQPSDPVHTTLKPYFMENGSGTLVNSDNGTRINIVDVGSQTYSIMATVENLDVEYGKTYKLDFDSNSTVDRNMEITVENASYDRFFDKTVSLTSDSQHFHYDLTFDKEEKVDLKFQLGNTSGASDCGSHSVLISNLKWKAEDENITQTDILYGDINMDGQIDLADLVILSQYCLRDISLTPGQLELADVMYSGEVDVADLARLRQFIMKDDIVLGLKK